jgi:hypothetical protein
MATDKLPATGFFEKHRDKIAFGISTGCWLWAAAKTSTGYGNVRMGGGPRKAHREAYEAEHGAGSADGLVVRHKCDTRLCVNPDHLELGTQADNVRDRDERERQAKGETNGRAKLTDDDVRAIRATYVLRSRTHGQAALARQFGVSGPLIGQITRRELWRHVL